MQYLFLEHCNSTKRKYEHDFINAIVMIISISLQITNEIINLSLHDKRASNFSIREKGRGAVWISNVYCVVSLLH